MPENGRPPEGETHCNDGGSQAAQKYEPAVHDEMGAVQTAITLAAIFDAAISRLECALDLVILTGTQTKSRVAYG